MRIFAATSALFLALALPASADKGGGNVGDTSPGNSGDHKIVICHHAGPNKVIQITVDNQGQLNGHLKHGDTTGPCPTVVTPPDDTGTTTTPTPTVTDTTPTAAPAPGAPVTGEQPEPTTPTAAPEGEAQQPPKDEAQLLAPEAVKVKHKSTPAATAPTKEKVTHAQVVKAAGGDQLPYTGVPAGLIGLAGIGLGSAGIFLRRLVQ